MRAALIIAAGLLAVSSFAFAGNNNGGGNKGAQQGMIDSINSGSVSDGFDPPDETTVQYCKTARIKDANCKNALSR
jgi:hypothetical protein